MDETAAKISQIILTDSRYRPDAYKFILSAVQKTVQGLDKPRHLSAEELLGGISRLARLELGIFDSDVFTFWGIKIASDIGNIVYNMIEVGILAANSEDEKSDFDIDFELILPIETQPKPDNSEVIQID